MPHIIESLIGRTFGRLTVVAHLGGAGKGGQLWHVECACGETKAICGSKLKSRETQSCGCLVSDGNRKKSAARRQPGQPFRILYRAYRSKAKRQAILFDLTYADFAALLTRPCFYCAAPPAQISKSSYDEARYNGVDRFENNKGYVLGNVVSACGPCNRAKRDYPAAAYIERCKLVAKCHAEIS